MLKPVMIKNSFYLVEILESTFRKALGLSADMFAIFIIVPANHISGNNNGQRGAARRFSRAFNT
ncbi:MAG: hypothetical protein WBM41_03285 [Arenicellales bacterium]